MKKKRIDQLLVERGMVSTREKAQRLIIAGKVLIANQPAKKPGQLVDPHEEVRLTEELKYVSRGGLKLEKALDEFGIDVADKVVLDIGASTGGFTDCVLQRNAKRVYAVDVGYGQIAWKLRQDARVIVIDRTNARNLTAQSFAEAPDLAVMDVSFIGSSKILEPLAQITREVILLFKPQFEAGPENVPAGGVIRDPQVHRETLLRFFKDLDAWQVHGLIDSPIEGGSGNREFLVHLTMDAGWNQPQFESKVKELLP